MSQEVVMKFFEAVRKDQAAVERLRAVSENVYDFALLSCELGRERGFTFDPPDVRATLDALAGQKAGELSEKELSAVAGGRNSAICYGGGGLGSAGCTTLALGGRPIYQWVNGQLTIVGYS